MSRPRLLDLGCGAGGAAVGYARAGFEVVGVDIAAQPRFPFQFIQGDMLTVTRLSNGWLSLGPDGPYLGRFDAVHSSPPCQADSQMSRCRPGLAGTYPRLIAPMRERLGRMTLPWVIENVVGAPLINPTLLCGEMFGLRLHRHRLFESNVPMPLAMHPPHSMPGSRAGRWKPGTIISVAGNCAPIAEARAAMGIDWMRRDELAESIPPAFTEWVGRELLSALGHESRVTTSDSRRPTELAASL